MGEIAEMILEGVICQYCGSLIDGEETGYPRTCDDCKERRIQDERKAGSHRHK
jgi:predicted Zn-ribbon and HTH transcriptional regulator